MDQLIDKIADGVQQLDISSCYLVLYENPELSGYSPSLPEFSRLVLGYKDNKRMLLPPEGERFPTSMLVPKNISENQQKFSLIMTSLYFQKEQIGFVLFERSSLPGHVYEILRGLISSSIKGALLLKRHRQTEEELRDHRDNLEKIVKKRTVELANVNEHLRTEIEERKEIEKAIKVFQSAVETSTDGIRTATPDGEYYYQNEAFEQMFGIIDNDLQISKYVDYTIGQEIFRIV